MRKLTETKIVTSKGAELRVFISGNIVNIETPIGNMIVDSVTNTYKNIYTIVYHNDDKKMSSNLKTGAALVSAMLNCVNKENRDLYIDIDLNEIDSSFGTVFEIVESSAVRYTAAYKYINDTKITTAQDLAKKEYADAIIEAEKTAVDRDQDWEKETTYYIFEDESTLIACATDYSLKYFKYIS